jgi:hypothetical protein
MNGEIVSKQSITNSLVYKAASPSWTMLLYLVQVILNLSAPVSSSELAASGKAV